MPILREFIGGENRNADIAPVRGGSYSELIVNDAGFGRYFEAARADRLFCMTSGAPPITLNGFGAVRTFGSSQPWALVNPPNNNRAAVILRASCIMACGATSTPISPVWVFVPSLLGFTTLGDKNRIRSQLLAGAAGIFGSSAGTMLNASAGLFGVAHVSTVLLRSWLGSFNEIRHLGDVSETSAGVITEETDGSIILPPNTGLSVNFNVNGAAVSGCVSVVYAEVDWPLL
jgi:hypothetical protein